MALYLVTGGAGFIGSNLCRTLLEEGHSVHGVDNFITGSRENIAALSEYSAFTFIETDIAKPDFASHITAKYDYIFHLACPTGVPNLTLLATEMLHTCSYGMFNILDLAKAQGSKFLFTSTAEIYGQPEKFPQDEEYTGNVHPMGIRSAYEEGKRFSESCLAAYVRYHGVDGRVVRVFNTFGPGMSLSDQRVIPQFVGSVKRGEAIRIYGDGSQTRTHLYVDDLVRGLHLAMNAGTPGEVYNIGGEHPLSIRSLAELVIELTTHEAGIEYVPHFIEDHRDRRPSVEKARSLGWRQEILVRDGLQILIDHHIPRPAEAMETASENIDQLAAGKLAVI